MVPLVPREWLPNVRMQRVIVHWTAGAYQPSDLDALHYHILIDGNCKLVRGAFSIADNVNVADGAYAAHTARLNTGSIGVAVCAMAGARRSPFRAGSYPMTERQWKTMAQVVAQLCQVYSIPVSTRTVLGHGEVPVYLGIDQGGKWDPMVLPWAPEMSLTQVGNAFRALVERYMTEMATGAVREPRATVVVRLFGDVMTGLLHNEVTWVPAAYLAESMGWGFTLSDDSVVFQRGALLRTRVPVHYDNGVAYVPLRTLAERFGWSVVWDGVNRAVVVQ